ncbi:MAG: hypothetical protein E6G33_06135 [Actinobacteria bacterium]|nr:MAG: hypothetical protein E6G33_06135 [Actinomycetota bacterium]
MEGYPALSSGRLRLALSRGDLEATERLLAGARTATHTNVANLSAVTTRLDGLAALRDRARIETEAPRFLLPNTYLEPFALRALGIARGDETPIAQALERFEAMQLDWHADQTRELL